MKKPRLGKKGRKALAAKKAAPKKKAVKRTPVPKACPEADPQPDCCNRENADQMHAPGCVSGLGGTTPGESDGCAVGGTDAGLPPEFNQA